MKKLFSLKTLLLFLIPLIIILLIFTIPKKYTIEGEILEVTEHRDYSSLLPNSSFTIKLKLNTKNNDIVYLSSYLLAAYSDFYNDSINNLGKNVKIEYRPLNESNFCIIQNISTINNNSSTNIKDIIETLEVKTIEPIVFVDFRPDIEVHGKNITHYAIGVNKSFYKTAMFNGEGFVIKEGIGEVDWVPYDVELKIYYVEYNNEKVILNYEELN